MADRRRTSETQMADLNMQLDSQTEQIKNMRKVAQENNNITNDIQGQLYRQRGVIEENISKNKQIAHQVKIADKKTAEMRRRALCTKGVLWIVAILLFLANIGLIIWKVKSMK